MKATTTPALRIRLISRVKGIVLNRHFNIGNVDYAEWATTVDEQLPGLLNVDEVSFEIAVRKLLCELKSSHTNFYRSDASQPVLPQHAIGATFTSVPFDGVPRWMVLDVFDRSAAAHAGVKPGHVLVAVDDAIVIPPSLPTFQFGQKQQLTLGMPGHRLFKVIVNVPPVNGRRKPLPLVEPYPVSYYCLDTVAVLRIPFFSGSFGIRFSRLLDRTMQLIKSQGCNRLIVDLRGCLGGSLGFARLASYMYPDEIPIGYDLTRSRLQHGYELRQLPRVRMPSTRLGVMLCLARFSAQDKSLVLLTQGLGQQPYHGRIAVLVNEWTNSAGEMLAQFAQDAKVATVIGKQTKGNVLGSTTFDVGAGYCLYLPVFGWYSPNGMYLEGSGVQPDIKVDMDPERLRHGEDPQFEKAIEILR